MDTMKTILVFLSILVHGVTYSQTIFTYPSEKEINIAVTAATVISAGEYKYIYRLKSLPTSQQKVSDFEVVHLSLVDSIKEPSGWWGSVAPVIIERVSWSGRDTVFMIAPGDSLSGFSFISNGLPSPGDFYARGWIPLPGFLPGQWPDSVIGGVFPENSFHGKTLVPRTPPTPFNGLNFLDTIKSYINQSRSLGWITNDPTASKYTRLIDTARFHLQGNNRGVTKAKLDSVLVNANSDSARTLTSEAYALLRFNTEYVLKKLDEE